MFASPIRALAVQVRATLVSSVSVVGSGVWTTLISRVSHPFQLVSAQFARSGSTLLVAFYGNELGGVSAQADLYRSSDGGSAWNIMKDFCSGKWPGDGSREEDLISMAGAPGGFLLAFAVPIAAFRLSWFDRRWKAMVVCRSRSSVRTVSAHCDT